MSQPLNVQRRQRILAEALELSLLHGFRGTSMEAVARRAEVAKPTLYRYFADKETLFLAVVEDLIERAKTLCMGELEKPGEAPLRIGCALAAKHKMFFRLMERSPFATELYMEKARLAGPQIAEFERWLENRLVIVLERGGKPDNGQDRGGGGMTRSHKKVQLVIACADGVARKARQVEQIGPAIRELCEKLLV